MCRFLIVMIFCGFSAAVACCGEPVGEYKFSAMYLASLLNEAEVAQAIKVDQQVLELLEKEIRTAVEAATKHSANLAESPEAGIQELETAFEKSLVRCNQQCERILDEALPPAQLKQLLSIYIQKFEGLSLLNSFIVDGLKLEEETKNKINAETRSLKNRLAKLIDEVRREKNEAAKRRKIVQVQYQSDLGYRKLIELLGPEERKRYDELNGAKWDLATIQESREIREKYRKLAQSDGVP